jgi:hypothetical protein
VGDFEVASGGGVWVAAGGLRALLERTLPQRTRLSRAVLLGLLPAARDCPASLRSRAATLTDCEVEKRNARNATLLDYGAISPELVRKGLCLNCLCLQTPGRSRRHAIQQHRVSAGTSALS